MIDTLNPAAYGPVTRRKPKRGRQLQLILVMVVLAASTIVIGRYLLSDERRNYLSSDGWPTEGQGAYQVGDETPAASANQHAVPIASLAKVMTAYLVLQRMPLDGDASGPDMRVTKADVADTAKRRDLDQSLVDVKAGERLSERAALMALLLPSANNIAALLARAVSGSVAEFVYEMNVTANHLGMANTVYTDPSGYDAGTVSTAIDQLKLAKIAAADRTLSDMMAISHYTIPVEGEITNTNTLLGQDGFVGMKTGSDDAAGGCFMFRSWRVVHRRVVDVVGVVLGQHGHNLITAGLYAAKELVDRVAPHAAAG
jgi:serine-type D-Ala-D-Ala carboxypeptidase (penicillin-binding protein 5/6)